MANRISPQAMRRRAMRSLLRSKFRGIHADRDGWMLRVDGGVSVRSWKGSHWMLCRSWCCSSKSCKSIAVVKIGKHVAVALSQ